LLSYMMPAGGWTNRVMGRRRARGRRVLWLSLAISLGFHIVVSRLGFMPSISSIFDDAARRAEWLDSEGMLVLPVASPEPRAVRPTLPPELSPDAFGDEVVEELRLAPPELDSGPGAGRSMMAGRDALTAPPIPLTVPWARYPPEAIEDRVSGVVVIRVLVRADGRVAEVEIRQGLRPDCDRAAVDAAKRLVFQPAREAGRNTAAWTEVEIEFDLGES